MNHQEILLQRKKTISLQDGAIVDQVLSLSSDWQLADEHGHGDSLFNHI